MKTIIAILIVILILGGGWVLWKGRGKGSPVAGTPSPTPQITATPTPSPSPGATKGATVTIAMVSTGFSPASITITKGTTVVFVNEDTRAHWPASGVHPTHQLCPGFDALRGIAPGERYSYTFNFTPPKTCPFHDHLNPINPSLKGTITIQ